MASKATVLVVEDNELNMKMAIDLLDLAGFDILQAEDAEAGICLAKSHYPDLVLMDMHLPACDGYEATRIIKATPELRKIPVVAFTALAMEDEQKRAIQSGCIGVISKPIDVDTFAQTVESYLPLKDASLASADSVTLTDSTPTPSAVAREDVPNGSNGPVAPEASAVPHTEVIGTPSIEDVEGFIYRVSHDLQAPLRKIRQFSSFLKDSAKDELSAENYLMLEALDRSASQMYELLSDLLLLSRIGRVESNMVEFSLAAAVEEAIKSNQSTIDELHAQVELGDMLPIEGNYQQLVQVFHQMIQNSLKYHSKDVPPYIYINCRRDINSPCLEITIQDNGLGFKKEHADKIFQPLQRLHGVTKFPGTGVGLAIVKKIVDRHQGFIKVESAPNQGTTFTITLPVAQTKDARCVESR